jgi:hypothetical protein
MQVWYSVVSCSVAILPPDAEREGMACKRPAFVVEVCMMF